jgi:hypothetical protein
VFQILGEVLIELLTVFGWRSIADAIRPERHAHPVLATIGQFVLGMVAGILSLLIVRRRIVGPSPVPGLSLILSPIGTGIAMHLLGKLWPPAWGEKPGLMSFWAGAIFAFGMVLVRFVYLEDPWQWWPR